jgi:hypothetical protein
VLRKELWIPIQMFCNVISKQTIDQSISYFLKNNKFPASFLIDWLFGLNVWNTWNIKEYRKYFLDEINKLWDKWQKIWAGVQDIFIQNIWDLESAKEVYGKNKPPETTPQ